MSSAYPNSLSDAEWDRLQRFLPPRSPHGRLRRHSLRSVFDALFYLLRTGCPWRYLPSNFPPWQTVYYHFKQFCRRGLWTCLYRALRAAERRRVGRDPDPSAAIMDAQSVKTVEESGCIRGYDAHKCVKGASVTSWSIPWACRSPATSRQPTYTIPPARAAFWQGLPPLCRASRRFFWQGLPPLCRASRRFGQTKPTKDTLWPSGARRQAAGSLRSSGARRGCAGGASSQ